ncbi:RepB family plasmid replication initiator protein, partial [Kingella kingae]|uniref:RepB family plasmid replication initiator protein n=1 Tax=Kingella kingae TaxID=504 RepID=UPI002550DF04
MGILVVKDNALIEASHRLSEIENRLILLAIVQARAENLSIEQLTGKELTIHADEYVKIFGTDN